MTINTIIACLAAGAAVILALAAVIRRPSSIASWSFLAGMLILAIASVLHGLAATAVSLTAAVRWETLALAVSSFMPGVWLCFSLVYSRGNYQEFLTQWRFVLLAAAILPPAVVFGSGGELYQLIEIDGAVLVKFTTAAKILNGLLLVASVLILTNFEKTFRAAVGTLRWRIKFAILGLGLIFGATVYTRSEAILFSIPPRNLGGIEAAALLIGCMLIPVAYVRRGLAEIDVYPSREVLQSSLTLTLAGAYLLVVGILAQVVVRLGGAESFQSSALIVLVGIAVLTILLTSDRVRQGIQRLVSRHFTRPRHNYAKVWTAFTQRTSGLLDQSSLCTSTVRFVSETFDALSVSIWLIDEDRRQLIFGASTAQTARGEDVTAGVPLSDEALKDIRALTMPVNLESEERKWAVILKSVNRSHFPNGGNRLVVPLIAGERQLGVLVMADRVNGNPYAMDELDLLGCIGSQVAAGLLNVRMARELMQAKELEAFQTMSAFFVHDLKNAASSLGLMLENLPTHFDDPTFREDALRGLGSAVRRITEFIDRLSSLRKKMELHPEKADLNQLVAAALADLGRCPELELVQELKPCNPVFADREQLQSVITNLLINAKDATNGRGRIRVSTCEEEGRVVLSVEDNGCGMTPEFLSDSLFRPFHTTKKKGLGIGMFQSKMIVEAHGGSMVARSAPQHGTTFVVTLPHTHRS